MGTPPMVPMYAPDGTLGDVPWDQMSAALRSGGHMGVHMRAPDGTEGIIPAESVQDAVKQGGRVLPYDFSKVPANQKGKLETVADDIKSVFSGLWETATKNKFGFKTGNAEEQMREMTSRAEAGEQADVARKAAGYSLPYRVAAGAVEQIGTNVTGMEQAAKEGNSDAVIGHMLAGQALAAAPLAVEGAGKVAKAIPKAGPVIGTMLRTETGALKPVVRTVAKVAGGATGHAVLPGVGTIVGYEGAPAIADALIPERPGAATLAERRAVPITKSPNYDPAAYKAGAAARTGQTPGPFRVAPPEAGPPQPSISEGRPATWTNERVIQLATQGNRDAITQAVRRGFMLPENVRYVMGDMDYPSAVHNPRSVTKFTPTGEPIVQGESDFAYRSRDIGEKGIPADQRSHAHATTDLEDLQQLAPGRASITGKEQEFVKVDLSKLEEGKDYARMHRPGQSDWIRFLRPLDEGELETVPAPKPATQPKPHRFSNSAKTRQEILDQAKEKPEGTQ